MIEREEFEAWRTDPVTQAVMRTLADYRERAKQMWLSASWGQGQADPLLLADLRARKQVLDDLIEMTFDELEQDSDEPERDQSN